MATNRPGDSTERSPRRLWPLPFRELVHRLTIQLSNSPLLQPRPRRCSREPQPGSEPKVRLVLSSEHGTGLTQRALVTDDDRAAAPAGTGEPSTAHARQRDRAVHHPIELGARALI